MNMYEAWTQFLVEHPTRGGIAERLIFEAGYNAGKISSEDELRSQGVDPLCKCGHRHLGAEVCMYCDCDENKSITTQ
jgi:hypothetical protein